MSATPQPDDTVARMADLQRQIDELGRKTFSQFAVTQYNHPLIKVYPDPTLTNPDGTPFIQMTFGSTTGTIWKLIPKTFSGNIVLKSSWGWFNDQTQSEELLSADAIKGIGLDKPYIPVVMYQQFNNGFSPNTIVPQVIIPNTLAGYPGNVALYTGYVALRSHPFIRFRTRMGLAAGGGTMTLDYTISGGLLTTTRSYSTAVDDIVDIDISSLPYNQSFQVDININGFSGTSGTTQFLVVLKACFLKGS